MFAQKELKIGIVLSYVSLGLHNVIGLLYTPFMLRSLGQSEYGLYSLAASIIAYLTILDCGLGDTIVRFTAKFRAENKKEEQYSLFGMIIICYTIIAFIVVLIGAFLYYYIDDIFGKTMTFEELKTVKLMMILLSFNLAFTFLFSTFGSIIIAYENFIFQKLIYILRIILQPCIMIPLLLLDFKAVSMVIVITVLNVISLLINVYYCFYKLKIKVCFSGFDWSFLRELGGYTFYTFLSFLVYRISWNSGQFILGSLVSSSAIAVYAVAMQLKDFYSNASTAISGVLLPKVTTMVVSNTSNKEISNLFIRIGRIQYIVMALILSGFMILGKEFISLWAGNNYLDAYTITLIIMIPLIIPLVQNVGVTILQARNQLKFRSIVYVIVAIVGVLMSIPLAKLYSGIGCAIATSFSLFVGNVIVINIYYWKRVKIDIPKFWMEIAKITCPVIIVSFLGFILNEMILDSSLILLILKAGLYIVLYGVIIWLFAMNKYEHQLITSFLCNIRKSRKC